MTKTKTIFALALSSAIVGCSSKIRMLDTVFDLHQPYRIIKHDFTQKYEVVPGVPVATEKTVIQTKPKAKVELEEQKSLPKQTQADSFSKQPSLSFVDVEFYNETAAIKNARATVETILNELDSDAYLIVGHSHGKSNIGVERLASERAKYMSDVLKSAGVPRENIFFISSWSDGTQDYSISKGVRVFALPDELTETQSLITGIISQRG